ncbi:hypothetical protein FYM84_26215 [Pseudomonas sp. CAH-1]|nr:hypothetical protein [Pseudomonas sp. CAH-1]
MCVQAQGGRALSVSHQGPLRGLARSHRICAILKACAVPVGAGKPAKRANANSASIKKRPRPFDRGRFHSA